MHTNMVRLAILFTFYIIGAFATTDILRLLKGSSISVSDPECFCPICGSKIPLCDQLPVVSYFFNRGKCRSCHSKIPLSNLFLEIFLCFFLSLIALFTGFSYGGLLLCILFYQFIKLLFLFRYGVRKKDFAKNLCLSIFHNLILFGLLAFLFFLEHLTS